MNQRREDRPGQFARDLWLAALATVIMSLLVILPLLYWASLPIVVVDPVTGECRTVYPAKAGDCDHLPERYERVFGAPSSLR